MVDFIPQPVSSEPPSEPPVDMSDVSQEAGTSAFRRFSDEGPVTVDKHEEAVEEDKQGIHQKLDIWSKIGGVVDIERESARKAKEKKEASEAVTVKEPAPPPLKINTESFYGNSSAYIPQSSPLSSPRFNRPVDPAVAAAKTFIPVSVPALDTVSSTVPTPPSTETSPSAVSGIWKDRRDVKEAKETTTTTSTSSSKGYRHRPDPLWRSVHSDGRTLYILKLLLFIACYTYSYSSSYSILILIHLLIYLLHLPLHLHHHILLLFILSLPIVHLTTHLNVSLTFSYPDYLLTLYPTLPNPPCRRKHASH